METGKSRVAALLRHEKDSSQPYWLWGLEAADTPLTRRISQYYGGESWREGLNTVIQGRHVSSIREPATNGRVTDAFGVVHNVGKITHVERVVFGEPEIGDYMWPRAAQIADFDAIEMEIQRRPENFQMYGLALGVFERSWMMRGMQDFLMDLLCEEQFACELLDGVTKVHLEFIDALCENTSIDAVYGGDDVSDQRGLMMGIDCWRKYIKPRQKQLIDRAHAHGKPFIMHACGNVTSLVDDLIEIGLDGLESIQPEANDLALLQSKARGKLLLIGGLGVQSVMPFGTPQEVRAEVERLRAVLGDEGGYVFAPAKPLDEEPLENIVALLDTLREMS